jgi:hypothetical protein
MMTWLKNFFFTTNVEEDNERALNLAQYIHLNYPEE